MRVSAQRFPLIQIGLSFFQRFESFSFQGCLLCVSHAAFNFSFAVGVANTAGHGDDAIMCQHVLEQRVQRWIVDVRRENAFLQVIENNQTATAAQAAEGGLVQLSPDACAGTKCQQADGFPAAAQSHDEQARPPVLARLRIPNHRTLAVIDLRFFSGMGDNDAGDFGLLRAADLDNETLHRVVGAAEAVVADQVLPDGYSVAAPAQRLFNGFPEWLTGTLRQGRGRERYRCFF
jgi:hypothetical protein